MSIFIQRYMNISQYRFNNGYLQQLFRMYWQNWTKGKVNHKELKPLKIEDKITQLLAFSSKYKHSEEWTEVIIYVLKHEQDQQFTIMSLLFERLFEVSKVALGNALDNLSDELKLCRGLGVFYLIMKYLMAQKYNPRNLTTIKVVYSTLIQKYSLFQKQILGLEDISPSEYPKGLISEISVAVEALPRVFEVFGDKLNLECLEVLLSWLMVYPQKTKQQIQALSKFCSFLSVEVVQLNKYNFSYNREAVIKLVMVVIDRLQMGYPGNQNLYMAIEHLPESAINSLDETSDIINTDVSKIIMALNTLTKAVITPKILRFIYVVSDCFRRDEDFHALHRIYKEFILPQLVKRGKALTCQPQLQRVIEFFVYGFMDHAGITEKELENFVVYSELISRKNMSYWLKMAVIVSHSDDKLKAHLKAITADLIKGHLDELLTGEQYLRQIENCWEMDKNDISHQRKKYSFTESKVSGIKNQGSNCYIISAIQALNFTKLLPEFIKSYSKQLTDTDTWSIYSTKVKLRLLYELNSLMKDLKDSRSLIKIDSVKLYGPQEFRKNQNQQDCHEYMIQMFDCVEKEIAKMSSKNKASATNDFKNIFQLGTEWVLECENCGTKQNGLVASNIHSIGVHEHLSFEWTDRVAHTCDKCKVQNPERQQKFKTVKFPQILLVHLKRFEFKNDKSMKKLGVSEIPRIFEKYQLLGFISHIGRSARCGHYVFYCRKDNNPLIWYEFNDDKVYEFKLGTENELFERNFKASNTPYILIYKMTNKQ